MLDAILTGVDIGNCRGDAAVDIAGGIVPRMVSGFGLHMNIQSHSHSDSVEALCMCNASEHERNDPNTHFPTGLGKSPFKALTQLYGSASHDSGHIQK